MITVVPATKDRGAEIRLPWRPPPITLTYKWGFYTINGYVRSFDPFEALSIVFRSPALAVSAMKLARDQPGEVLTFSWRSA